MAVLGKRHLLSGKAETEYDGAGWRHRSGGFARIRGRSVAACTEWHLLSHLCSMGEGRENIAYATASGMEGPWTYRGELTGMAENSFTIHPAIVEFKGKWYLFYHNAALTLDGRAGAIGRRSVCVDELHYNEDGTMQYVEQTKGN